MSRESVVVRLAVLALASLTVASREAVADGPFQFNSLTPCRVFDTRATGAQTNGQPLANPGPHSFRIQGNCAVPNGAKAVTLNVTITQPNVAGDLRLFPAGAGQPVVSTLNYNAGEAALANGAIVPLAAVSAAGDKDLSIVMGMAAAVGAGRVHVLVDVTGYFQ